MALGNERRQYPRVSLTHVTVEVYDSAGQPDKPEFCFIINVSENGMLFKTESHTGDYAENKRVRLTFTLPDNNIIIRTDAVIIHIRETELSEYVGAQFKNLGSTEQRFLRDFVQKSLQ
jgi:c-di-GMP-binding flagellar brake protein YcgR